MRTGMREHYTKRSIQALLLAFCICFTLALGGLDALAAGTTTLSLSTTNPKQGETVTLDVNASASAPITIKYTNAVLQLKSCSADYTADGNAISFTGKSATIVFDTIATGKANIIVSSTQLDGCSAVVNVAQGDGTAASTPVTTTETTGDTAADTTDTTADGTAEATAETAEASPFVMNCANDAITLSTPDDLFSSSLTSTTVTVGDMTYDAYQYGSLESAYYFLYGTNGSGATGWFQYDADTGVLQTANEELITYLENQIDSASASSSQGTLLGFPAANVACVLIFIIIVLVVIIVNLVVKKREEIDVVFGDDDREDEEEEEDTDEASYEEDEEYDRYDDSDDFDVEGMEVSVDDLADDDRTGKDISDESIDDAASDEDEAEEVDDEPVEKKPHRGIFGRKKRKQYEDEEDDEEDEEDVDESEEEPEERDPLPADDGDLNDFWGEKAQKKKNRKKFFANKKEESGEDEDDDGVNGDFEVIDLNDL